MTQPSPSRTVTGAMRNLILAAPVALLALSATAASAQEQEGGRRVRIGLGAQAVPRYAGAEDVQIQPLVDLSLTRAGRTFAFEAPDEAFGFNILGTEGLGIGPSVTFQSSRRNKDVGVPIGKVKTTIEAGAFVQYMFGENFRLRVDGRKGLGGHDAFVGDVSADFVVRDGDRYVFSVGPRAVLSDSKYNRAYFGVTGAQSAATGLPIYRPDGGLQSVGASTSLTYQFNDRWGVIGYARYDRLVDDAADSPIVRQYGTRDQFSGGLALTYTFDVR